MFQGSSSVLSVDKVASSTCATFEDTTDVKKTSITSLRLDMILCERILKLASMVRAFVRVRTASLEDNADPRPWSTWTFLFIYVEAKG